MIHYIKGVITETMPGKVIIENGGIGYEVHVPDNSSAYLAKENETICLYTAMTVREDDVSLFGFTDRQSLNMFDKLLTVNGVGAKAAMSILSALTVNELKRAIAFEDAGIVSRANGIGKKTAQRIILELKEKVGLPDDMPADKPMPLMEKGSAKEEAVTALMALGYSKTEAMSALIGITETDLSTEEYIKRALRSGR